MTMEITDTNSQFNDNIPDGTYEFEIIQVIRKEIGGKKAYEWKLSYDGGEGKVLTWPNQVGPLLAILGAKEDPAKGKGHYLWETELMAGKTFKATISHDVDKKNPSKVYQNMKDFKSSSQEENTPF